MSTFHAIIIRIFYCATSCNAAVISTFLLLLVPVSVMANSANRIESSASYTEGARFDREIRINGGTRTSVGQYPFLSAVLSGRHATLRFEDGPSSALFFSGGVIAEFSGQLVDCGFAMSVCIDVVDKVCSIILDFPVADHLPLTPAMQLQNCRRAGGIAAVFRPNTRNYTERLDLYDGNPSIPAVYVNDEEGYQHLLLALAESKVDISITHAIPDNAHCGGTYLGGRWILTAAQCVVRKLDDGSFRVVNPTELLVNVGAYNLEEEKLFTQGVEQILINDYRIVDGWDENDYALLQLDSQPQRGEGVKLVTDDILSVRVASAESALVIGWHAAELTELLPASVSTAATANKPLAATLQLQSTQSCRARWRDLPLPDTGGQVPDIRDIHLCASSVIQDTCPGHAGGPLLIDVDGELQVAGVTSFGSSCANSLPGVYARVPAFRQWILSKTGLLPALENFRVMSSDITAEPTSGGGSVGGPLALVVLLLLLLRQSRNRLSNLAGPHSADWHRC